MSFSTWRHCYPPGTINVVLCASQFPADGCRPMFTGWQQRSSRTPVPTLPYMTSRRSGPPIIFLCKTQSPNQSRSQSQSHPHPSVNSGKLTWQNERQESIGVLLHRFCSGVTGLVLGIAIFLSDGEMVYAHYPNAATSPAAEATKGVTSREKPRSLELEVGLCGLTIHHHQNELALDPTPRAANVALGGLESGRHSRHHHRLMGVTTTTARDTQLGARAVAGGYSQLEGRSSFPLTMSRRSGAVHEMFGQAMSVSYDQLVERRDDAEEKMGMFTNDAWLGMNRLKQYNDLVEKLEAEEKLCSDCTRNRRLLEQVWQTVSNEYYDQYGSFSQSKWSSELFNSLSKAGGLLRSRRQTYNTIKEMVESLGDHYSAFLSPYQYRIAIRRPLPSEIKYLAFQYTGVGMELGKSSPDGGLTVVAPFAGSPAEEGGILAGERLFSVDDVPVDSLSPDEAGALLRGPIGSMVELELSGIPPECPARRVLLERRALPLPPLRMRMVDAGDGQVLAYLRLHYFTHEGTKNMASAIREGEALGVDGYILDLRNNPGGVFEEAIAMAALWLDCADCDVAETVRTSDYDVEDLVYSVNNLPKEIFKRHPGTLTHAPLAIITNRSSASASEVFTGALHDNKRAMTVGEKTFGKGVVQYFFPMDDGSGLKLTIAKYLTPSRYDISKKGGLVPDSACNDYPHESGQSDKCINEAVTMLTRKAKERHDAILPYRWLPLPLLDRRPWGSGSY